MASVSASSDRSYRDGLRIILSNDAYVTGAYDEACESSLMSSAISLMSNFMTTNFSLEVSLFI